MKLFVLLISIVLSASFCFAQDSSSYFISKLSWESLFIKPTYAKELVLSKSAEKVIAYKNDKTSKMLFCALSDTTKTVAAHMILSRMYEMQNESFTQTNIYEGDSIIIVRYTYNTLEWQYNVKAGKYSIELAKIKKIKEYWKKKLRYFKN